MPAYRRIDPAMIAFILKEFLKKPLPHSVQPLEFEIAGLASPFEDGGNGQRIVRRKGRANVRCAQHILGTSQIGDIGRRLAGEERIIG